MEIVINEICIESRTNKYLVPLSNLVIIILFNNLMLS